MPQTEIRGLSKMLRIGAAGVLATFTSVKFIKYAGEVPFALRHPSASASPTPHYTRPCTVVPLCVEFSESTILPQWPLYRKSRQVSSCAT